jgi:obg-like ATPase 1
MSKEKKEDVRPPSLLGRPTNNVSIGIVGFPNVGKSLLFNCLVGQMLAESANFPFCTINPNVAKVSVPDDRFDFLVTSFKPKSVVPAVLTVTDIAGLVKGAHEGQGLGNAFLSNIQAVDAIYHVVRGFKDDEVEHVEGSLDSYRDLDIISNELRLKDSAIVKARLATVEKEHMRNKQDKAKKQEFDTLTAASELLDNKKDIRNGKWTPLDADLLNEMQLLSAKPVVYLVNIGTEDYCQQKNKQLAKVAQWVKENDPGAKIIPFSASFEHELGKMEADAKKKYLEEKKVQSAIPKIITVGYHTLDLVHYFTAGEDEVRAWTIKRGTLAPRAAGVIHTDFEKNFISAESMSFEDFKHYGSESAVKAAGKYKTQGKLWVVDDGSILFFKFGTSGAKKK